MRESGASGENAVESVDAFVGMGSNLGDRLAALRRAASRLNEEPDLAVIDVSTVYETEAHVRPGDAEQPDHLNAVVWLRTERTAEDLLTILQRIEREAGRSQAAPKWSPRPLDLDLLLFGDRVMETCRGDVDDLIVPHPRMAERRFVLQPLADLVHNLVVPGADNATVADLLNRCPDARRVKRTGHRLVDDPTCRL